MCQTIYWLAADLMCLQVGFFSVRKTTYSTDFVILDGES